MGRAAGDAGGKKNGGSHRDREKDLSRRQVAALVLLARTSQGRVRYGNLDISLATLEALSKRELIRFVKDPDADGLLVCITEAGRRALLFAS